VRLLISFLILLAVILAVAAAAKWAFWPDRDLPVNRVRHTRIRLRLRLHPGRGFASAFECWLRWGRLAAFWGSKRARPALPLWRRLPIQPSSVLAGRAHYGLRLRVPAGVDHHHRAARGKQRPACSPICAAASRLGGRLRSKATSTS
jgi:hypothetical protein